MPYLRMESITRCPCPFHDDLKCSSVPEVCIVEFRAVTSRTFIIRRLHHILLPISSRSLILLPADIRVDTTYRCLNVT